MGMKVGLSRDAADDQPQEFEVRANQHLSVTLDNGEMYWLKQTSDGQRLEVCGISTGGTFVVQPVLSNVIEVGKLRS